MTAAAAAILLAAPSSWAGPGERSVTSHILIGLAPNAGFDVSVNGEPVEESPVVSSGLGIAAFEVDEDGLAAGPRSVVIGDPGDLVISGLFVDGVTAHSAVVHWATNLPSDSSVEYGETTEYAQHTAVDPSPVLTHSVELTGLVSGTTYHFMASSDDRKGHVASSGDGTFNTAQVPLVIEGVIVDSLGETWAAVSWNTNRPADSMIEYGITTAYGSSTQLDPTPVSTHHVTIDGLASGTAYHIRAHSDDGETEAAMSGDLEFQTPLPTLSLTDVSVIEIGDNRATVFWTTDRPADSRVEYGLSEEYGSSSPVDSSMVTEHQVPLTGLEPGAEYHYRVWSSEGGSAVASGDRTFATSQAELVMTDLNVGPVGQTWAVISWITDRPAATFVAYGQTDEYGLFESPGGAFVTEHSATLSGLAEGTLYHFSAVSFDGDQQTSSPDSTFVTMEGSVTGPPQLDGVVCDVLSTTSVVVRWTTDRPATSHVRYGTGGALDCETIADTSRVIEHSVLIWPIVPRVEYSFVAISSCGCDTTECYPLSFATVPPQTQSPTIRPVDIIKIIVTPDDGASAIVTWASDRPCSSWVDYGRDATYGSTAAGAPLGEATYQTRLTGLEPETLYHLRVTGWDGPGGEVVGEDVVFETAHPPDQEAPDRPTGVSCSLCDGGVEVRWDANDELDLAGYNVYRVRSRVGSIDWSRAVLLNTAPVLESRFVDSSVEPEAAYVYAVTAVDDSGNESVHSENAGIDTGSVTPGGLRLSAYPNPVRDNAKFVFTLPPHVSSARLRILSPSGRVVMETSPSLRSTGEQTLSWNARDPSGWPVGEGVYLCELAAGDSVVRTKLTVLH